MAGQTLTNARVLIACVLCAAVMGAACSSSPPSSGSASTAAGQSAEYSVQCAWIIDEIGMLPESYVELAGAAALPLPATGMQFGRSENGYRFSKFGMAIRAGASAQISIDAMNGDAYLDYDSRDPTTTTDMSQPVTFPPCPAQDSEWVIYAGGIWTTEDGCVDITVSTAETTEQARLGVRASC